MPPSPFVPIAQAAAAKYGVPESVFLRQINAESAWNPNARSSAGAMGLLQLMPGTARSLGVTNPFDPHQSIEGGAKYMGQLLHEFGGNVKLALAAYNAGPGNVKSGAWQHIPETVNYVDHILQGLDTAHGHSGGQVAPIPVSGSSSAPALSDGAFNALISIMEGGAPSAGQLEGLLASPDAAPATPAGVAPAADFAGKFANPVPDSSYARVDQGVDFVSHAPVRALGSGVIESVSKGMAGGTGDIIKELLDHPVTVNGHTYRELYYSEENPLVRQGQRVAAGAPVMAAGGNELGFLSNGHFAPLVGGLGAGTQPTQMGADFLAFLRSLGIKT